LKGNLCGPNKVSFFFFFFSKERQEAENERLLYLAALLGQGQQEAILHANGCKRYDGVWLT
jgi:hypothetical protein